MGREVLRTEHFDTRNLLCSFFPDYSAIFHPCRPLAGQALPCRLDRALVFGLPLLAFGLQMELVEGWNGGG
jgi:hypothetical protein